MFVNDKDHPVQVFTDTLEDFNLIPPRQGKELEIEVNEKQGVFVKIWETGVVLLSAYDLRETEKPT